MNIDNMSEIMSQDATRGVVTSDNYSGQEAQTCLLGFQYAPSIET